MSINIRMPESQPAEIPAEPNIPDNLMVPRGEVDQYSDPSTGHELPRPVGSELADPDSGSMMTNREKTMLLQARTLLMNRRV